MYNEKALTDLVGESGFKNVKITLVKKEGVSASAADLAKGMVEGNPVYFAINERNPTLVPVIEKHIRNVVAEKFGDKPLKSPLEAWMVEGIK